jgi:4-carboxymuconolactone decarboxylase
MLTVQNRPHELKLHVKGALNGGVPAAVDAFRQAREVFAALDAAVPVAGQNQRQPD